MKKTFAVIIMLYLMISFAFAGPVAFTTCLKAFGAYGAGCGTALGTCAATAVMPPAYLACIAAAMGITGGMFFGVCIAALLAPTP